LDAAETEKYVGDLEIAVDRLRSLYEQYFMGIEKLEPTVPRKDVDRRIYVLRKEQIRNTAQRFRFQMILQKYNTYQTHWMRICREIENGTYKRHLLKAKQRFGDEKPTGTTKAPASVASAATAATARPALAQPGAPSKNVEAELAALDEDFAPMLELDDDELEALDEPSAAPLSSPAPTARAAPGALKPAVATKAGPAWRKTDLSAPRVSPAAAAPTSPKAPAAPVPRVAAAAPVPAVRAPAPAAPVAVPRPASAAAPVPRPAPPSLAAPAAAARSAGDIPDERVRQIYSQYVETKRQQHETTAAITFEAVAKSLRDSSAKLREKHGKNVDFEVSVKDGKTILKPVLK
jgi:hypothetical protein